MVASIIASVIGSNEGTIKLLISLLVGYPLAFLYRSPLIYNRSSTAKHIFFSVIGICICYYNFGIDSAHLVLNVTVIYLLLLVCGGSKFSVTFAFIFNTAYLLRTCYLREKMPYEYTISLKMPHSVLALRLTGVVFDYYDGQKKEIPTDLKESALRIKPGYLEMMGHVFFFGGVMAGPQFSLKRYLNFVKGVYVNPKTGSPPYSIRPGLERLALGVAYIIVYQAVAKFLPNSYFQSSEFVHKSFLYKCVFIAMWGKNSFNKYIGVWLITEGSIILTGLSYNGTTESGVIRWDACKNVSVWKLETGESSTDFIQHFNINSNKWMSRYIFKRLKCIGNKTFSHSVTLFYCALWHGLDSGYYLFFFLELLYTQAEIHTSSILKMYQSGHSSPSGALWTLLGRVVRKCILVFLLSYAFVAFVLLDYNKWFPVYQSLYHVGIVLPLLVVILSPIMKYFIQEKTKEYGIKGDKLTGKKL